MSGVAWRRTGPQDRDGGRPAADARPRSASPRDAGEGARLHIDWTRCDGRGLCTELLPEALGRDEWGFPLSRGGSDVDVPPALVDAARDAVALCPRAALGLRPATRRGE